MKTDKSDKTTSNGAKMNLNLSNLFWDYKEYSNAKTIQRTAAFFPQIGRDKKTVIELYKTIDTLKIPEANKKLIRFYYELIKTGELT